MGRAVPSSDPSGGFCKSCSGRAVCLGPRPAACPTAEGEGSWSPRAPEPRSGLGGWRLEGGLAQVCRFSCVPGGPCSGAWLPGARGCSAPAPGRPKGSAAHHSERPRPARSGPRRCSGCCGLFSFQPSKHEAENPGVPSPGRPQIQCSLEAAARGPSRPGHTDHAGRRSFHLRQGDLTRKDGLPPGDSGSLRHWPALVTRARAARLGLR